MASSTQEIVGRIVANKDKVLRYTVVAQIFAGVVLLFLGWYMGHDHFRLVTHGVKAQGTIAGYKTEYFQRATGAAQTQYAASMPVVRFSVDGKTIEFENWLGSSVAANLNRPVTVIYDPARPANAMIDGGVWNWLPWLPILALGTFLLLAGLPRGFTLFASR